jgi:cytochrome c
MVLGTTTYFNYDPSNEEAKSLYARIKQVAAASLENKELAPAEYDEMKARLRAAESELLYVNRKCKGDASETGLV